MAYLKGAVLRQAVVVLRKSHGGQGTAHMPTARSPSSAVVLSYEDKLTASGTVAGDTPGCGVQSQDVPWGRKGRQVP